MIDYYNENDKWKSKTNGCCYCYDYKKTYSIHLLLSNFFYHYINSIIMIIIESKKCIFSELRFSFLFAFDGKRILLLCSYSLFS